MKNKYYVFIENKHPCPKRCPKNIVNFVVIDNIINSMCMNLVNSDFNNNLLKENNHSRIHNLVCKSTCPVTFPTPNTQKQTCEL